MFVSNEYQEGYAAGKSAATEAHAERYDEAIRRAEKAERERDEIENRRQALREALETARFSARAAHDSREEQRKILDDVARAVNGWTLADRQAYVADELPQKVGELRARADSKVSDGSWRERAEKAERERDELKSIEHCYRGMLDAIACAVHGWPEGARNGYAADQLEDRVRAMYDELKHLRSEMAVIERERANLRAVRDAAERYRRQWVSVGPHVPTERSKLFEALHACPSTAEAAEPEIPKLFATVTLEDLAARVAEIESRLADGLPEIA